MSGKQLVIAKGEMVILLTLAMFVLVLEHAIAATLRECVLLRLLIRRPVSSD